MLEFSSWFYRLTTFDRQVLHEGIGFNSSVTSAEYVGLRKSLRLSQGFIKFAFQIDFD